MKRAGSILMIVLTAALVHSCSTTPTTESRLREWYRGVWLSDGGGYTVWTDAHYFVVSAAGDSSRINLYCGSSQVRYTDKGIARRQTLRIRQLPGSALQTFNDYSMYDEGEDGGVAEAPLEINMNLFEPGVCNVVKGVIYDSVTEETPEYIVLSSCNGDRIKIFSDGRMLYIPSGGRESWSYRIETW